MTVEKPEYENLSAGSKETFDFHINDEILNNFSILTGDHNSLHNNEEFARRTRYRGRIVHGMLPFSFISSLRMPGSGKYAATIIRIEAKFISPVYPGSNLTMTAEVVDKDPAARTVTIKVTIKTKDSEVLATTGLIVVKFEAGEKEKPSNPDYSKKGLCLLTEPVEESKLILEEINAELARSINFSVTSGHILEFETMINKGMGEGFRESGWNYSPGLMSNILSSNLFSTFVGMCIPGQNATFLDYDIVFSGNIPLNENLTLQGKVFQKSEATRIIKLKLSILSRSTSEIYATGNASVIVNPPAKDMPHISEIAQSIDLDLKDKVVLITGSSRGIGETTAKAFALLGSKVIVNYYKGKEDAEKIVREILEYGADAIALHADVSKMDDVLKMVDAACEKYGTIDILVNNAVREAIPEDFMDLEWNDIQKDIDVTLKGAFNCCKTVIPLMLKSGGGSIINISTIYTENPPPKQFKYVVSKSGLVGLTRSLAAEYASKNIRVNMVLPSMVETDLVAGIPPVFRKQFANASPMKRNAAPIEVARAIIFLASSYSSYTTGQKILVTGGSIPFL